MSTLFDPTHEPPDPTDETAPEPVSRSTGVHRPSVLHLVVGLVFLLLPALWALSVGAGVSDCKAGTCVSDSEADRLLLSAGSIALLAIGTLLMLRGVRAGMVACTAIAQLLLGIALWKLDRAGGVFMALLLVTEAGYEAVRAWTRRPGRAAFAANGDRPAG